MSAESRSLRSTNALPARSAVARREHLFFGSMTIAMLIAVLVGFGPTYFFSTISGRRSSSRFRCTCTVRRSPRGWFCSSFSRRS